MSYFFKALEKMEMYNGTGWHLLLFGLVILYLCACRRKKENKRLLLGYSVVFFLIYFCPVTAKIIMDYCTGESVYWRMLWLLPIPLIVAYACTMLVSSFRRRLPRLACGLILACAIIAGGRSMHFGEGAKYEQVMNLNKLPDEVITVCETILQDGDPTVTKKAVIPDSMAGYVRQYTAQIELVFGRRGLLSKPAQRIYDEMISPNPDFDILAADARKLSCGYLVYPCSEEQDRKLQGMGYEPIGEVNGYRIYRDTEAG